MKEVGFILIVFLIMEICFGLWLKHEGENINDIMEFCCITIGVVFMYCVGVLIGRR